MINFHFDLTLQSYNDSETTSTIPIPKNTNECLLLTYIKNRFLHKYGMIFIKISNRFFAFTNLVLLYLQTCINRIALLTKKT